jgi:hypothetical protein
MMVGEVLIQDGRPPNAQLYLAKQPMFKDNVTCHTIIERNMTCSIRGEDTWSNTREHLEFHGHFYFCIICLSHVGI